MQTNNQVWDDEPMPSLVEVLMAKLAAKEAEIAILRAAMSEPDLAMTLEDLRWEVCRLRVRLAALQQRAPMARIERIKELEDQLAEANTTVRSLRRTLLAREKTITRLRLKGSASADPASLPQ